MSPSRSRQPARTQKRRAIARLLSALGLLRWLSGPHAACRAASSSAWRSPAHLRAIPKCCFSMSRPPASIPPPPSRSRTSSRGTAEGGVKVVMATHDLGQARRLAGDIVFLANGALVEQAPAATFFETTCHVGGQALPGGRTCHLNSTEHQEEKAYASPSSFSRRRSQPLRCRRSPARPRTSRSLSRPRPRRRIQGCSDLILPKFKAKTGIDVKVIAQGTGQALDTAGGAMPTWCSCTPRHRKRSSSPTASA